MRPTLWTQIRRFLLTHSPERIRLGFERRSMRVLLRRLEERFRPQLEAAKAKARETGDRTAVDQIESEWRFLASEISDTLREMDTSQLLRRARKHDVDVPREIPPDDPFQREHGDWVFGDFGNSYLNAYAFNDLDRAVKQREREHEKYIRERWQFWIGITATVFGLALSAYNVFVSSKSVAALRKDIDEIRRAEGQKVNKGRN